MSNNKYIPLLLMAMLLFTASKTTFGQCFLPKGITTHPDTPVNMEKPSKTNTFFDWRTDFYNINSVYINYPTISSPYAQDNNIDLLHFLDNPDQLPEDGWELIKYDMGYNEDGTPKANPTGFIYLVLYNKYTGILRVFVAGDQVPAYNGAQIKLQFADGVTEMYSSALSNASEIFAVEEFEPSPAITSFTNYKNDSAKWFYTDFHMAYDPCTCFYESSIYIEVNLIDEANISLTGDIEGTIVTTENNAVAINEDRFSFNGLIDLGKKAKKSYESIDKFRKKQENALKTEGKTALQLELEGFIEKATKVKELDALQKILKKSDFLKGGLKAAPYIAGAMELVNFFIGGGKSPGPQEVKIMPMALQANVALQGSITATYPFTDITFYTPGSKDAAVKSASQYPYYNEILGVFNFLETPKLSYKVTGADYVCGGGGGAGGAGCSQDPIAYEIAVKVSEFNYVFNQAVTNQLPEMQAAIHFEFNNHQDLPEFLSNDLIDIGNNVYRTGYIPVDCLSEFTIGFSDPHEFNNGGNPFPSKVYMKLLINIPVEGNQQNVLMVTQYPMQMAEDNTISTTGSLTGISSEDMVLENTSVTGDVLSWKSITIGSNVTIQPGVKIAAGEGVIISPNATIPAGVTISSNLTNGCTGYINPMNNTEISNFCNSSKYTNMRTPGFANKSVDIAGADTKNPEHNAEAAIKEGSVTTEKLIMYPNPVKEQFYIALPPGRELLNVEIYNMQGEQVATAKTNTIPLAHLAAGMYFVQVQLLNGETMIKKIIVSGD